MINSIKMAFSLALSYQSLSIYTYIHPLNIDLVFPK